VGGIITLQSQTSGLAGGLYLLTEDADGTDDVSLILFGKGTGVAADQEMLQMFWDASASKYYIGTEIGLSGTVRPLSISTSGNADQILLNIDGTVSLADISGDFTVNTTDLVVDTTNHKVEIGSADGSDKIQIYHNNTDAYIRTNDGSFIFQSNEGANAGSTFDLRANGTGTGSFIIRQGSRYFWFQLSSSGRADMSLLGTDPLEFMLQQGAECPITMFRSATEGETQELQIYGWRTDSGGKESLDISVEQYAANTAEFYGLSEYRFDGTVRANTAFNVNGSAGVSGTLELDDGSTEKVTLVFTGGILTSRTVAATTGSALVDWTD